MGRFPFLPTLLPCLRSPASSPLSPPPSVFHQLDLALTTNTLALHRPPCPSRDLAPARTPVPTPSTRHLSSFLTTSEPTTMTALDTTTPTTRIPSSSVLVSLRRHLTQRLRRRSAMSSSHPR